MLAEERYISVTDWPTLVQEATFACNSYVNASTGYSPHEVMYASQLRTKADAIFPFNRPSDFRDIESYCRHAEEARKEIDKVVHENIVDSQQRMERNYNRGAKVCDIQSGDLVWLRDEARRHSLSPMYRGPWMVTERRGVNIRLVGSDGVEGQFVHVDRCKKASHIPPDRMIERTRESLDGEGGTSTRTELEEPREMLIAEEEVSSQASELPEDCLGADQTSEEKIVEKGTATRKSSRRRKEPDRYGEWV